MFVGMFLAFYTDKYKYDSMVIRMPIHLRVERPSVSRRVSACMSPTSRDVRTSSERDVGRTREPDDTNVKARFTRRVGHTLMEAEPVAH